MYRNALLFLLDIKNIRYEKNTYYTLSFILVGIVLLGGRYLGYGFMERVISAFVVGGLFELVYRKKLKK